MNRFKDWLNQANEDLSAAIDSMNNKHHEWACFQAQQAAEKSLKGLLLLMNLDVWGHGLIHLLNEWGKITKDDYEHMLSNDEQLFKELFEKCQELDRHYIQPRYPNGFASGYPAQYYNKKTAEECINNARIIIKFVKEKVEKISASE